MTHRLQGRVVWNERKILPPLNSVGLVEGKVVRLEHRSSLLGSARRLPKKQPKQDGLAKEIQENNYGGGDETI